MLEQPIFELSRQETVRIAAGHPWVTLVSHLPRGLVVSHLPVIVEATEDSLLVLGHLARTDADLHELGRHDVVLIHQGPHGYISPDFYVGGPYVPTWNFVVVHLHGRPELVAADETFEILDRTVEQFESVRPKPFRLSSVADYARAIAPQTTGFRLTPSRVVGKGKLSQDKPERDWQGVVAGLERDPIHGNPDLSALMRAQRDES